VATRESPWSPPISALGDVPLDGVLKRAVARSPDQRTATPREIGTALRTFLVGSLRG
jgi:hypothetical protein